MAEAIAALPRRGSRAVLFYGSCAERTARRADARFLPDRIGLSRTPTTSVGWRAPTRSSRPTSSRSGDDGLAAKCAVLSEAISHGLNGPETRNCRLGTLRPAVGWYGRRRCAARNAPSQRSRARRRPCSLRRAGRGGPARLVAARLRPDLFGRASPERKGRSRSVVDADRARYDKFQPRRSRPSRPAARAGARPAAKLEARRCRWCGWPRRARPMPAAPIISCGRSTATPGPISELKPSQRRRHPLLAASACCRGSSDRARFR